MKYMAMIPFILNFSIVAFAAEITCVPRMPAKKVKELETIAKQLSSSKQGKEYKDKVIKQLSPYLSTLMDKCTRENRAEQFPNRVDVFLEIDSLGENKVQADSLSANLCKCISNSIPSTQENGSPPAQPFIIHLSLNLNSNK